MENAYIAFVSCSRKFCVALVTHQKHPQSSQIFVKLKSQSRGTSAVWSGSSEIPVVNLSGISWTNTKVGMLILITLISHSITPIIFTGLQYFLKTHRTFVFVGLRACAIGFSRLFISPKFILLLRPSLCLITDKEDVIHWMLDSRFHVFACQAVSDGESYVRATSLSTLQTVLLSSYRTNLLQDMNTTIVSEWN